MFPMLGEFTAIKALVEREVFSYFDLRTKPIQQRTRIRGRDNAFALVAQLPSQIQLFLQSTVDNSHNVLGIQPRHMRLSLTAETWSGVRGV